MRTERDAHAALLSAAERTQGQHRPLTRLDRWVMSDAWAIAAGCIALVSLICLVALLWHLSAKSAPVQQPQCERDVRRPGVCRVLMVAAEGGRAA